MFLIPNTFFEIRTTDKKGRGVFAKKDIAGGTVIGDYIGIVTESEEVENDLDNHYEMSLTEDVSVLPDKNKVGIHLINHNCSPNLNSITYDYHVLYYAARKIFAHEELTIDYEMGSISHDKHKCSHECFCESPLCRGTMHNSLEVEYFLAEVFEQDIAHSRNKFNPTYGKTLPKLNHYPKSIADQTRLDIFANNKLPPLNLSKKGFPDITTIREKIRTTGRAIKLTDSNNVIWGILKNNLLLKTTS